MRWIQLQYQWPRPQMDVMEIVEAMVFILQYHLLAEKACLCPARPSLSYPCLLTFPCLLTCWVKICSSLILAQIVTNSSWNPRLPWFLSQQTVNDCLPLCAHRGFQQLLYLNWHPLWFQHCSWLWICSLDFGFPILQLSISAVLQFIPLCPFASGSCFLSSVSRVMCLGYGTFLLVD